MVEGNLDWGLRHAGCGVMSGAAPHVAAAHPRTAIDSIMRGSRHVAVSRRGRAIRGRSTAGTTSAAGADGSSDTVLFDYYTPAPRGGVSLLVVVA